MSIDKILNDINIVYLNNLKIEAENKNYNSFKIIENINEKDLHYSETLSIDDSENLTYTDEFVYKKEWNKLHNTHKIIKIKEFVNKLNFKDESKKKILKRQLVEYVKKKKLTKKCSVNYNSETGNIISIPNLEFVNNNYHISI